MADGTAVIAGEVHHGTDVYYIRLRGELAFVEAAVFLTVHIKLRLDANLLELKEQQKENKRVCGNCYSYDYDGYIFVDAMGTIFNPNAVTENFSKILKRNGLRHIRFHDLRHSCASLLLANDVPMKQIQEWLGHSDISTTANIYSHLDYKSKITSANVMDNVLALPDTKSQGW